MLFKYMFVRAKKMIANKKEYIFHEWAVTD